MTEHASAKPRTRLFYLDNLRTFLSISVIVGHAALAYGGSRDWSIQDPAVDDISPIFFGYLGGAISSCLMPAFFLLAGYFTPRSFERKGSRQFLKDRFIRLGIPIVIATTIIFNINEYMLDVYYRGVPYQIKIVYHPLHLWFLQILLLFTVIYVIFRALADRISMKKSIQLYRDTFPPDASLFLCIGVLAILTFAVRLVFPTGVWFLHVQPGYFIYYTFCFCSGVLAYRGDWFRRLSKSQARRWGVMSLGVIPLLAVIGTLEGRGSFMENAEQFSKSLAGGLHWEAFVFAVCQTFLMVGVIVFLSYFFRERLNQAGPVARFMAVNVYTVYIIHATILFPLQILMLSINIPTIVKFLPVALTVVFLCFLLSSLIRRIPYVRRVLG